MTIKLTNGLLTISDEFNIEMNNLSMAMLDTLKIKVKELLSNSDKNFNGGETENQIINNLMCMIICHMPVIFLAYNLPKHKRAIQLNKILAEIESIFYEVAANIKETH